MLSFSEMAFVNVSRNTLVVLVLCLLPSATSLQIVLKDKGFTEVPSDLDVRAITLVLISNNIAFIPPHVFENFTRLKYLLMGKNGLKDISHDAFKGTALISLQLQNNKLVKMPYLGFIAKTLSFLTLAGNLINAVLETDIKGMDVLSKLNLDRNPLISVANVKALLPSLTQFSVKGIQFKCCQSVKHLKDVPESVLEIDVAPCRYPRRFIGLNWTNIMSDQLYCGRFLFISSLLSHSPFAYLAMHTCGITVINFLLVMRM